MPWLHSASGWSGLLKRSRSPQTSRDREPVNAAGRIKVEHGREFGEATQFISPRKRQKGRILASEFLTRQRSNAHIGPRGPTRPAG